MINVNDFKTGITIKLDNDIYQVVEFQHVKPGKGAAFVRTTLKNLRTGATIEKTFNSGIKVETAHIERRDMQYLYSMGNTYYFMNMETYDQIELDRSSLGDNAKFLKENLIVSITSYEGEIIGITLPDKIEYTVVHSEPAVKGNTSTGAMKDATLENDLVIKVPLFIGEGEKILVTTKDGKYSSRA
ncbi:MAG TPA: elongation factor P [Candidatus Scybalousia intestinigallinarum]|nr:elongation factor P [Candidatus Scybalousia intestinigallinarum]